MDSLFPAGEIAQERREASLRKLRRRRRVDPSPAGKLGEATLAPSGAQGWAVRLRPRAGFGWGEPVLAGAHFFAWLDEADGAGGAEYRELLGMAVYLGWHAAERRAAAVRSRELSARPVPVWIEARMRELP